WAPVVYQIQYRYTPDYQYSTVNVDYGSTAFIPILDRAGYTFRGWSITGAGLEAEYSRDGQQWYKLGSSLIDGTYFRNMSSETGGIVTMDAEWNSIEYRLSYNTNGGTGVAPVDTNVYKVGDPVVMKDYKELIGTNGSKIIIGWSLEINGSAVNVNEFTQGLCTMADATNTVNFYGVWVNDMCTVVVNLEGSKASAIPAGWVLNADGTYEMLVAYGTSTKEALTDWDDVNITKDGYNFSGWEYDTSTVMSTVTAYPTFDKVQMSVVYIFGGVIAVFAAAAIFFTFRR
ncbi:MAG: InlB B-repeat-containing protein, partial [Candidatus Methanomethylophilaceae archaeon]|nr:InlB B-repeat-containing protein [Candidatus Methanomethylophilaceae archaeon]